MFCLTEVLGQVACDSCGRPLRQGQRAHVEYQEDHSVIWLCPSCYPQVMDSRYVLPLPEANASNS